MKNRLLAATISVLLGAGGVLGSGCSALASRRFPPARKFIFIDQSESVSPKQRAGWIVTGKTVLSSLHGGDSLYIFAVHDRTADAAPLFAADLPELPVRPTSRQMAIYKKARAKAISDGTHILEQALATTVKARSTDVFSLFDRCRPDAQGRPGLVFALSDMLHEAKDVNLARERLEDRRFPELISAEAGLHGWGAESLRGASVFVVLPGAQPAGGGAVNGRVVLERFYRVLVSSLGGQLVRFDTHLQGGDAK